MRGAQWTMKGAGSRLGLAGCVVAFAWSMAVPQIAAAQHSRIIDQTISSQVLGTTRGFHVYLPPSCDSQSRRRYSVLYLQDGQNVFSTAGTNVAFGWGNWALDITVDELCRTGKIREIIMVAVDNSPARMTEYAGPTGAATNAAPTNTDAAFERYATFLIKELKPKIDREYRTRTGPADTAVMGSSLGGICSVGLAWEYPKVFGRAASLSGSFQIQHTNFLNSVLRTYHGRAKPLRIYLDSGVMDFTGGDDNRGLTWQVAVELMRIGCDGLDLYVDAKPPTGEQMAADGLRRDHWREAGFSQHNEFYWRLRAWRALVSLFGAASK
jgi:predicted alpha/beta superfamily hydrolase